MDSKRLESLPILRVEQSTDRTDLVDVWLDERNISHAVQRVELAIDATRRGMPDFAVATITMLVRPRVAAKIASQTVDITNMPPDALQCP